MKVTRWLMMAGMATALCLSLNSSLAQDAQGGGNRGGRNGGQGGFGGRGNFDPAQFQQMMMERTKERLEITDDAEWKAIEPMVQKVMDLERQNMGSRMRGMMGGRRGGPNGGDNNNNGQQDRRNAFFGTPMPEAEALQKAIDSKASSAELKAALTKYTAAVKAKQAELEQAKAELRKVLTVRQEAIATASGLL